ncbi:MAG: hypothetical protein EBX40_05740 [Gammaproteobacteria bacterium]|nr:hypothetical protein [Gammaproteobacteria bacterium]
MTASMMSEWKVSELTGLNSAYLEGLYESYVADPSSVSADVRAYFDGLTQGNVKGEVNHSQIQSAFRQLATQPAARAVSSSGDPHRFVAIAELINRASENKSVKAAHFS